MRDPYPVRDGETAPDRPRVRERPRAAVVAMTTSREDRARAALLAACVEYVLAHGLADLSLRPLAAAAGTSPRIILYYFSSKDELVDAVVAEIGRRRGALLAGWATRSGEHDSRTLLIAAWQWLTAPRHERLVRAVFEIDALALRDRRRYAAYLHGGSRAWSDPIAVALEGRGFGADRARSLAELIVATARGLLYDVLAGTDRTRADRAFRSFIAAIELPDVSV